MSKDTGAAANFSLVDKKQEILETAREVIADIPDSGIGTSMDEYAHQELSISGVKIKKEHFLQLLQTIPDVVLVGVLGKDADLPGHVSEGEWKVSAEEMQKMEEFKGEPFELTARYCGGHTVLVNGYRSGTALPTQTDIKSFLKLLISDPEMTPVDDDRDAAALAIFQLSTKTVESLKERIPLWQKSKRQKIGN